MMSLGVVCGLRPSSAVAAAALLVAACQAPAPPELTPIASAKVETASIDSANPRWPSNLLDGLDNDTPQTITGRLSLPRGATGPLPAMIIVHGSGGFGSRGLAYETLLNKLGVATLRTDSFRPRGVASTVGNQRAVSTFTIVADAFSALNVLAADPRIDPARIGIMGFSKGGSVAQLTAFERFADAVVGPGPRFALHLPFYRGCLYDVDMPLTGAPVRELVGGADDYTGVDGCVAYAAKRKAAGDDYDITVYPGAHHGFNADRSPAPCVRCISFAACDWLIRADGGIFDKNLGLEFGPRTSRRIQGNCTKRGTTFGRNAAAAEQAESFVLNFVRQKFGLARP